MAITRSALAIADDISRLSSALVNLLEREKRGEVGLEICPACTMVMKAGYCYCDHE